MRLIADRRREILNLLTDREREVLCLVAQGNTSKEIGYRLRISNKTVDSHRENIKKKLQIKTIAEMVQCAVSLGLIRPICPGLNDE
jgi:DNA-binding CsgD family transcriptional regulator